MPAVLPALLRITRAVGLLAIAMGDHALRAVPCLAIGTGEVTKRMAKVPTVPLTAR